MQISLFATTFFLASYAFLVIFCEFEMTTRVLKLFEKHLTPIYFDKVAHDSFSTTLCYQKVDNENRILVDQLAQVYRDALLHQVSYAFNSILLVD